MKHVCKTGDSMDIDDVDIYDNNLVEFSCATGVFRSLQAIRIRRSELGEDEDEENDIDDDEDAESTTNSHLDAGNKYQFGDFVVPDGTQTSYIWFGKRIPILPHIPPTEPGL